MTKEAHKVYTAIAAVTESLAKVGVGKDQMNTFDRYKFRGIDDVYNALAPLLAKHKLCVLPKVLSRDVVERVSQKGGALFYVTVMVEYHFVSAEDGSSHVVVSVGEAMDRGDKATNKAMSAAYKYACFQAFCIPTEGDNDADGQAHDVQPQQTITESKQAIYRPGDLAKIMSEGDDIGTTKFWRSLAQTIQQSAWNELDKESQKLLKKLLQEYPAQEAA